MFYVLGEKKTKTNTNNIEFEELKNKRLYPLTKG